MCELAGYEGLALNLKQYIDKRRDEEFDAKYNRLAHAEFDLSKRLIGLAKHTYEHYDGDPIRCGDVGSRSQVELLAARITFAVEIVAAIGRLQRASSFDDPYLVHAKLKASDHVLCDAISNYLSCGMCRSWSHEQLRDMAATSGRLPTSHQLLFCGHPRGAGRIASLATDVAELMSHFEGGSGERRPRPVNEINVAIIQSALDTLPDRYADDRTKWFGVACAIHDFDSGEIGLALFTQFSSRCPEKAEITDFEQFWSTLGAYSGKKITLGSLIHWAKEAGWKQPRNWDLASRG